VRKHDKLYLIRHLCNIMTTALYLNENPVF